MAVAVKTKNNKLLVKIIVPVLIAITLTVIWMVKAHPTPTPIDQQTGNIADFVLEATSIDLDALDTNEHVFTVTRVD